MFAPLQIISGYSFLKSGLTLENIVKAVKKFDYFGAGICDINVMHGLAKFARYMSNENINKPYLCGITLKIKGFDFCLYCLSESGYQTLCQITSFIDEEDKICQFLSTNQNGLLGILSTSDDSIKEKFLNVDNDLIYDIKFLSNLVQIFYIGIDASYQKDMQINEKIRQFADKYTYLCVAFPKILYFKKDDAIVLKIVHAIDQDEIISEKNLQGNNAFLSNEEYEKQYLKQEIDAINNIFRQNKFVMNIKRGEMLSFNAQNTIEKLKNDTFARLKELNLDNDERYVNRLNYELDVIIKMGFSDYFLIVSDYVRFAESVGILVGPGRGSAAGSLVSYLLKITKIDPLKYDLLFERFLNPSRKKMPDIDIDFMDTRRDEVINYLKEKYGKNKVSNIITFSTILAKQSLRDIGRIYNFKIHDIDLLSSRLLNPKLSLRNSYKTSKVFKEIVDSDPYYLNIVSLASKIENLPRQSGMHAAGIILNNTPIEYSLPIIKDFQNSYITQYEMDDLQEQGFLKMDLLGLKNLTIISECVDLINDVYKEAKLNKFNIPFDDEKVFQLIQENKTMGIFQLESSGMKNAIKILKPSCFNDVVALLALFRPGPMDSIPTYARRKQGLEKINYISDDLKDILKETYGIIVYQEQIILIAQKMANFSLAKADIFRNAISKKNYNDIKQMQNDFINGALNNGYSNKVANDVFDHILKFASYGFNKSHSVAYSMIACQMAYLKAYYPLCFYQTILKFSNTTNDPKFLDYVDEMSSIGIHLAKPDINLSTDNFLINQNNLLFPLSLIKGINKETIKGILDNRLKNGLYKDFLDFMLRTLQYKISETQYLKLIDSGALDCLNPSRATLKQAISSYMQYALVINNDKGQMSLDIDMLPPPILGKVNDDPIENLENEYDVLGIMLSNNPLKFKKDLLTKENVISISEAIKKDRAKVCGIIKSIKIIQTKKQQPMAFIKIFDETKEMELTAFSDTYQDNISLIKKNNIVVFEIYKNTYHNNTTYIIKTMKLLEE